MSLALWVGKTRYEVGQPSFLKSFFSTVYIRLEGKSWGSRYPTVMNELYSGKLSHAHVGTAEAELGSIRKGLSEFGPEEVVWDFEDLAAKPPWGDAISPGITSLAHYFVTSDGKELVEVLREVCRRAAQEKKDVEIH
jgi:hypothetical protein